MRQSLIIAASILLAGASFSVAQNDTAQRFSGWRFQMAMSGDNAPLIVVCDTTTGQCWTQTVHGGSKNWFDRGIPGTSREAK